MNLGIKIKYFTDRIVTAANIKGGISTQAPKILQIYCFDP